MATPDVLETRRILCVAPWLEGGGAQRSPLNIVDRAHTFASFDLVVLFRGSRDTGQLQDLFGSVTFLNFPRGPIGAARAARKLARLTAGYSAVYSLTRASTVALGASFVLRPRWRELIASQHMLPITDLADRTAWLENVLLRRAYRHARLVTCPTRLGARQLVDLGLAPSDRVAFLPNPIRLDERAVAPPRASTVDPIKLLFLGRLDRQKGLDILLSRFAEAPFPRLTLDVVGAGPAEAELRGMANEAMTRSPNVTVAFHGYQRDPIPFIDNCDALVMPSRDELVPYSVVEAWSRGRPVVASDIPPLRTMSADGPILLVSTTHEWVEALVQLRSPERRAAAAIEGLDAAHSLVSMPTLADWMRESL